MIEPRQIYDSDAVRPLTIGPARQAIPKWLLDAAESVAVDRGTILYRRGDHGEHLYIVLAGSVGLEYATAANPKRYTVVLHAGAVFGEDAAVDPAPRQHTARALSASRVSAVRFRDIVDRVATDSGRSEYLLRLLAQHLRCAHREVSALVFDDAAGMIARELLRLPQSPGPGRGEFRVDAAISQKGFAAMIGLSRETVNRTLTRFLQRGWIRRDGRTVYLVDRVSLARRAALLHGADLRARGCHESGLTR